MNGNEARHWQRMSEDLRKLVSALNSSELALDRLPSLSEELAEHLRELRELHPQAAAGSQPGEALGPDGEQARASARFWNELARALVAHQMTAIAEKRARVGDARRMLASLRAPAAVGSTCDVQG